MNLKNNLRISKTLLLLTMLLNFLVAGASCKIFEANCNPSSVKESSGGEPVYITVLHGENGNIPENFEVKIEFDGEVFKKNAKINYSDEIGKNYRHNKSIFGNEISVKCSLKAMKTAPYVAENQEIFLLTMEPKKYLPKSETSFKVISDGNFGSETEDIFIKIERTSSEKSSAILTTLIPSQGVLSPEFSPNVNEYSVDVPYDTKDIEFDVDASNASGISINRHKLKAPGSVTDVFITVKGEKRGDKNIYHIAVNRDDKPDGENAKSKHGLGKGNPADILKQMMTRGKSSGSRKYKSKKYDAEDDYSSEDDDNDSNSKIFKEMEINQKENDGKNNGKLYSIIILSSLLCAYAVYMIVKKKKRIKNKKELNKISKK